MLLLAWVISHYYPHFLGEEISPFNPLTPKFKSTFSQPNVQGSENWWYQLLYEKLSSSYRMWCYISGEALGEFEVDHSWE